MSEEPFLGSNVASVFLVGIDDDARVLAGSYLTWGGILALAVGFVWSFSRAIEITRRNTDSLERCREKH